MTCVHSCAANNCLLTYHAPHLKNHIRQNSACIRLDLLCLNVSFCHSYAFTALKWLKVLEFSKLCSIIIIIIKPWRQKQTIETVCFVNKLI